MQGISFYQLVTECQDPPSLLLEEKNNKIRVNYYYYYYYYYLNKRVGWGSVVCIATRYGLEASVFKPR
jgi:hypothetical protein